MNLFRSQSCQFEAQADGPFFTEHESIDVAFKTLRVVAFAGCFRTMLRKAAASTRHAIWLAAIVQFF